MVSTVIVHVDGRATEVEVGSTLLQACDVAGRYVPRLCDHPAVSRRAAIGTRCGLCLVRLEDGSLVEACSTTVSEGVEVCTDDDELSGLRAERLSAILASHPHTCLSCPDREGCNRDSCPHGVPAEARCCDKIGSCELGVVLAAVDPHGYIPRRAVTVPREATMEGRIRREPGLCIACGRCVRICATAEDAGQALEMAEVVRPKQGTLRESGCTFCGLCVLVCPTGALTAPGPAGAKWLAGRREKHSLPSQVLPPRRREFKLPGELGAIPHESGVFTLLDLLGRVIQITGIDDLQRGVTEAVERGSAVGPCGVWFEVEPLYTQRETELLAQHVRDKGQLPPGNDLDDDLFDDDLFADDLD